MSNLPMDAKGNERRYRAQSLAEFNESSERPVFMQSFGAGISAEHSADGDLLGKYLFLSINGLAFAFSSIEQARTCTDAFARAVERIGKDL